MAEANFIFKNDWNHHNFDKMCEFFKIKRTFPKDRNTKEVNIPEAPAQMFIKNQGIVFHNGIAVRICRVIIDDNGDDVIFVTNRSLQQKELDSLVSIFKDNY